MKKSIQKAVSILLAIAMLFCCGMAVGAQDAATGIQRVSCTVAGDAATQRGFCWYTADDCETAVRIFDADGRDITVSLTVEVTKQEFEGNVMHKAFVSGLAAGCAYTYQVGDGAAWSEVGSFTTDDGDDNLNFIVVGDVQASSLENFEAAADIVGKAYEVMPDAEFYATLGDFTNDSTNEEWDLYGEAFCAINMNTTLVPITGNHDRVDNWFDHMFALDTTESVQTKNGVNYSFDYGNVHIAVVNTNDLIAISNSQLEWLKNDMNSTSADWKIVMMHKAPYSMGKDIKWPDAQYLQEALTAVCDETNVDIVMSGHDHTYLRTKPLNNNTVVSQEDGTTYILGGTPGTKRYEFRPFVADNFVPTEFLEVCISQKTGYGNYFNGTDFDSQDESNIGGCFNTVSVSGGSLVINTYIVSDADGSMKIADTYSVTKEQGENVPTFSGDNTTSKAEYMANAVPSFLRLARYAVTVWLPRFIKAVPEIISTYIKTGTF